MSMNFFSVNDVDVIIGGPGFTVSDSCPDGSLTSLSDSCSLGAANPFADSCSMDDAISEDSCVMAENIIHDGNIVMASAWKLLAESGKLITTEDGKILIFYLYG